MIINVYRHPKLSLYFIGAEIIRIIKEQNENIINADYVYDNLKKEYNDISADYFYYAMDWLFLLNIIKVNERGDILCE